MKKIDTNCKQVAKYKEETLHAALSVAVYAGWKTVMNEVNIEMNYEITNLYNNSYIIHC